MQIKPEKYATKTGFMQLFLQQNYTDFFELMTFFYDI